MKPKNIVVVGGGTAGWLTALYARTIFDDFNITLIQSSSIDILGAGEGSQPRLSSFLDYLGIDVHDVIKKTNGTFKHSVKFTNWDGKQGSYHHYFERFRSTFDRHIFDRDHSTYYLPSIPTSAFCNVVESNKHFDHINKEVLDTFKVPFMPQDIYTYGENSINDFKYYMNYSIHFDARLFAEYLENIGKQRNIKVIDSIVEDVELNEDGFVSSIVLEDGTKVLTDFVFDCTGFAKLIIGKYLKSKWRSFGEFLPMKKAIPFFIDIDKNFIPAYTEAIAMKYGWMWKIPLQNRYGCGYVFDSDYITEEEAKQEIENYLGYKPTYPRDSKGAFNFDPGCFEEIWVKNCFASGLSAQFVEPIEATSIAQAIEMLRLLMINKYNIFNDDQDQRDWLNKQNMKESIEIMTFLHLHYITVREDSDFWKEFKDKNKTPEELVLALSALKNGVLSRRHTGEMFGPEGYYSIGIGNGIVTDETIRKIYKDYNLGFHLDQYFTQLRTQENMLNSFIYHSDLLRYIGALEETEQ
jgi:tryptophan halogenase